LLSPVTIDNNCGYGIIVAREVSMGKKAKKAPPPVVRFAQIIGDHEALSRLGRAGAMRKKELAQKDREYKKSFLLAGAEEMAHQANEDICPLN
jgi:hypothetical protein